MNSRRTILKAKWDAIASLSLGSQGGRGPNATLVKRMDPYEVEPMVAKAKRVSLMAASKCHLGDLVLIEL